MLASAVPRVSWKWSATSSMGISASTRDSTSRIWRGVATPMVSPSDTW